MMVLCRFLDVKITYFLALAPLAPFDHSASSSAARLASATACFWAAASAFYDEFVSLVHIFESIIWDSRVPLDVDCAVMIDCGELKMCAGRGRYWKLYVCTYSGVASSLFGVFASWFLRHGR